jgi:CheY-like chemotaxis protein
MSTLLKNATILVIDDDPDTCEMLRILLEEEGADIMTSHTVEEALALCRRRPPHLIVSDLRLGASDGFELIAAIRKYNREYRGFTPAIALTGFVSPGEEERAKAAGFDAYIRKPVDPRDLVQVIAELLRGLQNVAA